MKRLFAFILIFALGAGLLPAFNLSVTAAGYGSNGKFLAPVEPPVEGSIPISTREELEAIKDNLSGNYHLVNDIDLSGKEWVPIGDNSYNFFNGRFDGQGYVIRNLTIMGNYKYNGLFGYANATIINVGMEGAYINITSLDSSDEIFAGGICGYGWVIINNCYNTGKVLCSSSNQCLVGGICGGNEKGIINCYNTGEVFGYSFSYSIVGGITGLRGSITNCYNMGKVIASVSTSSTFTYAYAGGICGSSGNQNGIYNCYNMGKVTASVSTSAASPIFLGGAITSIAGGICGADNSEGAWACYNMGDVYSFSYSASSSYASDSNAGGICGSNPRTISSCYNTGMVSASKSDDFHIGGIVGRVYTSVVVANSYCLDLYFDYGTQLTSEQMKNKNYYESWDFDTVWDISPTVNNGYPYLRGLPIEISEGNENQGREPIQKTINNIKWSDYYFLENSHGNYSDDLHSFAAFSAYLSSEAYDKDGIKWLLEAIEFEEIEQINYDGFSSFDHSAGYSLAHKKNVSLNGENYNLIAVVIRGTPETNEWYSNFAIRDPNNTDKDAENHYGFKTVSDSIYESLRSYLMTHEISDSPAKNKLLVTGHSRGGAAANLIAAKINASVNNKMEICIPENLFAFTFGTPNTTKNPNVNAYINQNIFNFVNVEDFVSYMPLSLPGWEFRKYGRTFTFPSKGLSAMYESGYKAQFESQYKRWTGKTYQGYPEGFGYIQGIVRNLHSLTNNADGFYENKLTTGGVVSHKTPEEYFNIVVGAKLGNLSDINSLLLINSGTKNDYSHITEFFTHDSDRMGETHDKYVYLAWMLSAPPEALLKNISVKYAKVACPVDVEVCNSKGLLVGRVADNIVDETINSDVYIFVDDDVKHIYTPNYDTYTFNMTGTDSGTLEYTVSEIDAGSAEAIHKKEFVSIALNSGKKMQSEIGDTVKTPDTELLNVSDEGAILEILEDGAEAPYFGIAGVSADAENNQVYVNFSNPNQDTAELIVAVYEDDKLLQLAKKIATQNEAFPINVNIPENADKIKVMLWDNINTIKPLGKIKMSIQKEGFWSQSGIFPLQQRS